MGTRWEHLGPCGISNKTQNGWQYRQREEKQMPYNTGQKENGT